MPPPKRSTSTSSAKPAKESMMKPRTIALAVGFGVLILVAVVMYWPEKQETGIDPAAPAAVDPNNPNAPARPVEPEPIQPPPPEPGTEGYSPA